MKFFISFGVIVFVSAALVLLFLPADLKWMLIHSKSASEYAVAVMKGNSTLSVPDSLIDYTISQNNEYVLYLSHKNDSVMYGYFPSQQPSFYANDVGKMKWNKIGESWYAAHLN